MFGAWSSTGASSMWLEPGPQGWSQLCKTGASSVRPEGANSVVGVSYVKRTKPYKHLIELSL